MVEVRPYAAYSALDKVQDDLQSVREKVTRFEDKTAPLLHLLEDVKKAENAYNEAVQLALHSEGNQMGVLLGPFSQYAASTLNNDVDSLSKLLEAGKARWLKAADTAQAKVEEFDAQFHANLNSVSSAL